MKSKVLITGATGFVGACLAENLVGEGYEVAAFVRGSSDTWRLKKVLRDINLLNVDLCDEAHVNEAIQQLKPEKIFHMATYGGFPFQQDDRRIIYTNFIGTFNLVNACVKTGFESFINGGSSSEYGTKFEAMSESDILEPISTYGVTKAASTLYSQMISMTHKIPIITLRLFSPYGFYEDKNRLVPYVILSSLRGENPKLASKTAVRDFIFIEDAIDLMKIIAEHHDKIGKIYNVGSGQQHSVAEMVQMIIEETATKVSPEWGTVPGRISDTLKWEADMSLVKKDFNWSPSFSLQDGVRRAVDWFKENIDLYI